jgi:antirestriction protein ArdC
MKMDAYQLVTDKIVGVLETGVVPWRRPWSSAGLPRNLVTKKPYRGDSRSSALKRWARSSPGAASPWLFQRWK